VIYSRKHVLLFGKNSVAILKALSRANWKKNCSYFKRMKTGEFRRRAPGARMKAIAISTYLMLGPGCNPGHIGGSQALSLCVLSLLSKLLYHA